MVIFLIIFGYNSFSQSNIIRYKVKPGDNLSIISNKYNISIDDIKEFNGLINNKIYCYQILFLPINNNNNIDTTINNNDYNERTCLKKIYYSQIGIRELTGHNDGDDVEKYLKSAGLSKGYPWCASFVYWTFLNCGDTLDLKYPAWVPSYFPENKLIYVRNKLKNRNPKYGDLIGIWFNSKNRLAHIGFYDGENRNFYFTVEGNTNIAGSREGDGVYRKRRIKRQVHSISSWVK
jgi:LysM repeat protein